jgi:predicted nucleic acid-binding protein
VRILIDTNLLLAIANSNHAHHRVASEAIQRLLGAQHEVAVVPQNLYEFWVVLTRPAKANGFDYSTQVADAEIRKHRQVFGLLADVPAIFDRWQRLVVQFDVKGKTAHDARLVASMLVHGADAILTFNGADFARYPVGVLDPAVVAAGSAP